MDTRSSCFFNFLCYTVGPTVIWILDSPAFLQFVFTLFPMDRDMSDCMCRRTWQVGQLRQMLSILETTSLTFLNPKLYFFLISFVLQEVVNAGSPCRSLTWSSALVAVIDVENKKHTWTQAAVAWDVHAPRFQGWCSCCQQGPQTLVSIWLQRVHVAPPQKDRRSDFFASNLDCGHHLMSDCFLFTCPFI